MSRPSTVVGTISLLLALMADQVTAQRRSLSGRVLDEAGNPIGNAVVCTIESNALGAGLVSALSDKDGYFVLGADNRFSIPLTIWHDAYAISLVKAAAGTDA